MKDIYAASLLELLPESVLLDPKLRASAEALDAQFRAVTAAAREVLHLPRFNELSGNIIDYLAEQFHIDFYEPLYLTEAEKVNLIRSSIAWHRIKGTPAAVEQIAHSAFRDADIQEWFEYGGEPYHFKVRTYNVSATDEMLQQAEILVRSIQNARSHLEEVIVEVKDSMNLFFGCTAIIGEDVTLFCDAGLVGVYLVDETGADLTDENGDELYYM